MIGFLSCAAPDIRQRSAASGSRLQSSAQSGRRTAGFLIPPESQQTILLLLKHHFNSNK
jgi:hypothetical protein